VKRCRLSRLPKLSLAAAWVLAACGAKQDRSAIAPSAEPAAGGSSQLRVYSASQPQRNPGAELGKGDAPSLVQAVSDCDVTVCIGSAPEGLIEALRSRAAQARSCYERSLRETPELSGRMLLNLRIAHDGASCPFGIAQNELAESTTLVPCLRELLEVRYPRPTGGCVELNLPLKFVPEYIEVDAGAAGAEPPSGRR